jgi:hypothetical protein
MTGSITIDTVSPPLKPGTYSATNNTQGAPGQMYCEQARLYRGQAEWLGQIGDGSGGATTNYALSLTSVAPAIKPGTYTVHGTLNSQLPSWGSNPYGPLIVHVVF